MTRAHLEHIIRAAGTIANVDDVIIIGSQAVLGQFPDARPELLVSKEADVIIRDQPDRGDLVDASIGEGSPFQRAFGYYAHGVDYTTAVLPEGWRERLVLMTSENTRFIRGWCLEVHDLAIAKYVAGREKDREFTVIAAREGMVSRPVLEQRLATTALDPVVRAMVAARIEADFAALARRS
jgi:hypothetical protein